MSHFFKALKMLRLDRSTLLTYALWIGKVLVPIWVLFMFMAPPVMLGFDWQQIQNVWDRWQALNAGMLAFAASLIALSISRELEANRQKRRLVTARAFLPHALSELLAYLKECIPLLYDSLQKLAGPTTLPYPRSQVLGQLPAPPVGYKSAFAACIEHADEADASHLAQIIENLQVLESRLSELAKWTRGEREPGGVIRVYDTTYIHVQAGLIGKLHHAIESTYDYARFEEDSISTSVTVEDVRSALKIMGAHPDLVAAAKCGKND